jgi:glutathione S-transferase
LYPSHRRKPHTWRTQEDPFADAFESEEVPLLAVDHEGVLEATAILAELNRRHPQRFGESQLRTLQRRIRRWRALNQTGQGNVLPTVPSTWARSGLRRYQLRRAGRDDRRRGQANADLSTQGSHLR